MQPKCSPEAPKHLQNRPKIDPKSPPGATRGPQVEPKSYFVVLGSILEPNLVPLGTQNRPKIDTLRNKCSKKRAFKAMFAWRVASPRFLYPFLVIFGQKTMKKTSRCCASCWYFPPLKNHVFYRLPCLRTVFLQICWNTKNLAKKREKTWKNEVLILLAKSSQKASPRHPKSTPNRQFWEQKSLKIAKNVGKSEFSMHRFFERKKEAKKTQKRTPSD